jgi:hypothetical protein
MKTEPTILLSLTRRSFLESSAVAAAGLSALDISRFAHAAQRASSSTGAWVVKDV